MKKIYNLPARWIWFNNITGYLFRVKLTQIITKGKEIIQILSGITPLKLSNAVSKNIINLIQYGKVIQNGTPTPDAPVDLVCNNGKLVVVDDELPIGYKRLIGIDFDGKFWYETGEALTGEDDITMTVDNTISNGQNIFGSYNGTASGRKNFSLYIYGGTASTSSYFRYGDQLKRPVLGSGRRTITFGKSGTSGFSTDVSVEPDDFSTPNNTYIGMLPNSSSPEYSGEIVGSILVSSRLKWIPCENPTGIIGYYEKYNGKFIAPSGTGTPVSLGYDTSHLTAFTVVGTPEVLSVESQTASVVNLFAVGDVKSEQNIISGVVTRKCGIKVLDGTENWQEDSTASVTRFRLSILDAVGGASRSPVLSSHFSYASSGQPTGGAFLSTKFLYIIPDQTITTVEAFTSLIAELHPIVIYPLAEEITESVVPQNLRTDKGTNIVSSVSEVDPVELSVTYYANK